MQTPLLFKRTLRKQDGAFTDRFSAKKEFDVDVTQDVLLDVVTQHFTKIFPESIHH